MATAPRTHRANSTGEGCRPSATLRAFRSTVVTQIVFASSRNSALRRAASSESDDPQRPWSGTAQAPRRPAGRSCMDIRPAGCSVGNEPAKEGRLVELPRPQQREVAVVTGGSLNLNRGPRFPGDARAGRVGADRLGRRQALASHVGCGDTITADTTLDSDLVNCPNNGIVIGAEDVTLDLNGHRIDGDGTPAAGCARGFCDGGRLTTATMGSPSCTARCASSTSACGA